MPDFLELDRCCDLVMKGGITSGILYPPAICRIAERFHLVGIGGTSAGAIAACAAAAAEYRRRRGDAKGYEFLEQIPGELAGEGGLTGLFRPDRPTRELHDLMMDVLTMSERSWAKRQLIKARLMMTVLRREKRLKPLIDNGFGICTGMARDNRPGPGEIAPLTEWLGDQIDTIAGKEDSKPLTFGDLRSAPIPPGLRDTLSGQEHRSIDLRAVTTCVSFGRPYELPFEGRGELIFAFDPDEWARFFPRRVMDYLIAEAEQIRAPTLARDGKLPLPSGDSMPVIVAARMSLSFPALFTMIPLYAVNYHAAGSPMTKVWFSDGGITSNLPIHRFDSVFPRWPTLGINLQYTDENGKPARRSAAESLVHLIHRREDGARDLWNVFDGKGSPVKDLLGFAMAVFTSAQVWHDNAFLRLPGFRDRVVEIWLRPDEGGMNLAMPASTIQGLIERGDRAGTELSERFADTHSSEALSWDGHRWARLRSGLSGLIVLLRDFKQSVDHPMPGDRTLSELLSARDAPPTYHFGEGQFAAARQAIERLLDYVAEVEQLSANRTEPDRPFHGKSPSPKVEVGTRAPI